MGRRTRQQTNAGGIVGFIMLGGMLGAIYLAKKSIESGRRLPEWLKR